MVKFLWNRFPSTRRRRNLATLQGFSRRRNPREPGPEARTINVSSKRGRDIFVGARTPRIQGKMRERPWAQLSRTGYAGGAEAGQYRPARGFFRTEAPAARD